VPGIFPPRHPERTVLCRELFHHFKGFVAEKPPPARVFEQVALMAAEEQAKYF
jgi:hypothetical protein